MKLSEVTNDITMCTYTIDRPPLLSTFSLPTREELLDVENGDCVKLTFAGEIYERMWVTVTERSSGDIWEGSLQNDPLHSTGLTPGDSIQFHPLDVIDIVKK